MEWFGASSVLRPNICSTGDERFSQVSFQRGGSNVRLGARRVFTAGIVVFTLGSFACAVATDWPLLIAARVLQGLGAAALLPCSLALIVHQFPARTERAGLASGILNTARQAGGALGVAILGSVLATSGSSPLAYSLAVPFAIAAGLLLLAAALSWVGTREPGGAPTRLPESARPHSR